MEETETPGAKVIHLCVFLAIVGAILLVGWNQPLCYRFMSQQEIDAIERPTPPPKNRSWLPNRKTNPLDNGPHHRTH